MASANRAITAAITNHSLAGDIFVFIASSFQKLIAIRKPQLHKKNIFQCF